MNGDLRVFCFGDLLLPPGAKEAFLSALWQQGNRLTGSSHAPQATWVEMGCEPKTQTNTENSKEAAWVAQSGKHPTLSFSSGHDLVRLSPTSGSVLTAWSLLGILSLPLSLCPSPARARSLSLSLSLSQNKHFKKRRGGTWVALSLSL